MKKKVLIVLAPGFEEVEAVPPIDVLRRAGLDVTVAGVGANPVEGAHGIRIHTDISIEKYEGIPDAIVLPGGMPGAENLAKSAALAKLIDLVNRKGNLVAAICASPAVVLAPTGLLDGKNATCYPSFETRFGPKTYFMPERVVCDGNVLTSRGPGTALEFSLEIAAKLAGPKEAERLASAMLAAPAAAAK